MSNGLSNPKASSGKIIASLLGGFALLVLLCALFLPTFFSSTAGKKLLLRKIESRSGVKLEIDVLSLSWFGGQSAQGIRLQKPEDQLMVTCKEAASDSPLWKMALRNDLGHLKLSAPSLQVAKPFQSVAHVRRAKMQGAAFTADPGMQLAMPAFSLPVTGEIEVTDGRLSFTPPELSPIVFNQVALLLALRANDQLSLDLTCTTTRQDLQGQIAIKGTASDIHSSFPKVALSTEITQLPVLGIDQLVSIFSPELNGLIYGAIGPTIDVNCQFLAGEGNFALSLKANSPLISAQIVTQTADGMIVLKTPATFTISVTPAFVEKWGKLSPALAGLQLARPASLQATLSEFSCPLPAAGADVHKASFAAQITAPQPLLLSLRGTPLTFNQFALQAGSDRIDERISLALSASLQTASQPGAITLNGVLTAPFSPSPGGSLTLNAAKLPVDLIGVAAGLSTPLSPLLGPTADLSADLSLGTAPSSLHLSWQSAYLTLPSLDLSLDNPWTLASPASLTLTLNPQLGAADPIQGTLQTLVIPTDNPQATHLEAALRTRQNRAYRRAAPKDRPEPGNPFCEHVKPDRLHHRWRAAQSLAYRLLQPGRLGIYAAKAANRPIPRRQCPAPVLCQRRASPGPAGACPTLGRSIRPSPFRLLRGGGEIAGAALPVPGDFRGGRKTDHPAKDLPALPVGRQRENGGDPALLRCAEPRRSRRLDAGAV